VNLSKAIAFVLTGWKVENWVEAMRRIHPAMDIRSHPDGLGRRDDIYYALAWRPPPHVLESLPNLKAIFSLGAGVDAILADPTLPQVPIVRIVDPDMTMRMSEFVVMHVLLHHRHQKRIDENQRLKRWDPFATHAASALKVGIMGFGVLGQDAGRKLKHMGFDVAGWSQSPKDIQGIETFAGHEQLDRFLNRTDVLVVLLPHTKDTTHIIDGELVRKLSRKGPFGAPVLINAGRGKLQAEGEIIECLEKGELYAASLDVFEEEPLAADSPLWRHPRVYVSPHVAADSDPLTICKNVLRQIKRYEAGHELENVVDRGRGY
jgi:glyoxylate/hydroxypyruvate reductase A